MQNTFLILLITFSVAFLEPTVAEPVSSGDAQESQMTAGEIMRQMLPTEVVAGMESSKKGDFFAAELSRLSIENVYQQLWTRPGLSLRDRSLVTISILIAQGNENELKYHIAAGLSNGLTPTELEEVIYHSTAYAGFPRAAEARAIAAEVITIESK